MPIGTIDNGDSGSSARTKINAALTAVDGLGDAATKNVGASAGNVAAGDDSRFSDARTPTAHASSHTSGVDDIQSATSSQKGLATATQITKLDGIEAGADVTDAANVATAGALMTASLGTGVGTALAIATGSVGAPVLYGGALGTPSGGDVTNCTIKTVFPFACSNNTDDLTTGLKETFRMPYGMTLTSVRINVSTAPTGSVLIVDVKEGGTSIFSTKPQIATSAKTSVGGAVPGVLSDTALADDAEITVFVDQIGSTIAGKGLKVTFIGTRS